MTRSATALGTLSATDAGEVLMKTVTLVTAGVLTAALANEPALAARLVLTKRQGAWKIGALRK